MILEHQIPWRNQHKDLNGDGQRCKEPEGESPGKAFRAKAISPAFCRCIRETSEDKNPKKEKRGARASINPAWMEQKWQRPKSHYFQVLLKGLIKVLSTRQESEQAQRKRSRLKMPKVSESANERAKPSYGLHRVPRVLEKVSECLL